MVAAPKTDEGRSLVSELRMALVRGSGSVREDDPFPTAQLLRELIKVENLMEHVHDEGFHLVRYRPFDNASDDETVELTSLRGTWIARTKRPPLTKPAPSSQEVSERANEAERRAEETSQRAIERVEKAEARFVDTVFKATRKRLKKTAPPQTSHDERAHDPLQRARSSIDRLSKIKL
jgi:hypothetical protein